MAGPSRLAPATEVRPVSGPWSEIDIAGHPADVYTPPEADPRIAAIYLHGVHLGRLVGQAGFETALAEQGLRVIAPRCGSCWWADRPFPEFDARWTPEAYLLGPVLEAVSQRFGVRPPAVGLFGTSMGGQGALRLAFKHPELFPVVAALAPALDFHLYLDDYPGLRTLYRDAEDARQDTALLQVHPWAAPAEIFFCCDPADGEWFEGSDRLAMKLRAVGVRHRADLTSTGGGHGWAYYNAQAPAALAFLANGLRRRGSGLTVLDPRGL